MYVLGFLDCGVVVWCDLLIVLLCWFLCFGFVYFGGLLVGCADCLYVLGLIVGCCRYLVFIAVYIADYFAYCCYV